jgi:hypothetical protein
MTDKLDNSAPFDDDQGTRVSDDNSTGAGAEASRGTQGEPRSRGHEHVSGYGGEAGEPKLPNEGPEGGTSSETKR